MFSSAIPPAIGNFYSIANITFDHTAGFLLNAGLCSLLFPARGSLLEIITPHTSSMLDQIQERGDTIQPDILVPWFFCSILERYEKLRICNLLMGKKIIKCKHYSLHNRYLIPWIYYNCLPTAESLMFSFFKKINKLTYLYKNSKCLSYIAEISN